MEKTAIEKITEALEKTGMKRNEIDMLLGEFLAQEAFSYVEYIKKYGDIIDSCDDAETAIKKIDEKRMEERKEELKIEGINEA